MRFKTRTLSPWAALLLSASLLLSLPFSLAEPVAPEAEVVLTDTQLAQPDVPPVQPEAAPQPAQPMVEPGLFFSLSIADNDTEEKAQARASLVTALLLKSATGNAQRAVFLFGEGRNQEIWSDGQVMEAQDLLSLASALDRLKPNKLIPAKAFQETSQRMLEKAAAVPAGQPVQLWFIEQRTPMLVALGGDGLAKSAADPLHLAALGLADLLRQRPEATVHFVYIDAAETPQAADAAMVRLEDYLQKLLTDLPGAGGRVQTHLVSSLDTRETADGSNSILTLLRGQWDARFALQPLVTGQGADPAAVDFLYVQAAHPAIRGTLLYLDYRSNAGDAPALAVTRLLDNPGEAGDSLGAGDPFYLNRVYAGKRFAFLNFDGIPAGNYQVSLRFSQPRPAEALTSLRAFHAVTPPDIRVTKADPAALWLPGVTEFRAMADVGFAPQSEWQASLFINGQPADVQVSALPQQEGQESAWSFVLPAQANRQDLVSVSLTWRGMAGEEMTFASPAMELPHSNQPPQPVPGAVVDFTVVNGIPGPDGALLALQPYRVLLDELVSDPNNDLPVFSLLSPGGMPADPAFYLEGEVLSFSPPPDGAGLYQVLVSATDQQAAMTTPLTLSFQVTPLLKSMEGWRFALANAPGGDAVQRFQVGRGIDLRFDLVGTGLEETFRLYDMAARQQGLPPLEQALAVRFLQPEASVGLDASQHTTVLSIARNESGQASGASFAFHLPPQVLAAKSDSIPLAFDVTLLDQVLTGVTVDTALIAVANTPPTATLVTPLPGLRGDLPGTPPDFTPLAFSDLRKDALYLDQVFTDAETPDLLTYRLAIKGLPARVSLNGVALAEPAPGPDGTREWLIEPPVVLVPDVAVPGTIPPVEPAYTPVTPASPESAAPVTSSPQPESAQVEWITDVPTIVPSHSATTLATAAPQGTEAPPVLLSEAPAPDAPAPEYHLALEIEFLGTGQGTVTLSASDAELSSEALTWSVRLDSAHRKAVLLRTVLLAALAVLLVAAIVLYRLKMPSFKGHALVLQTEVTLREGDQGLVSNPVGIPMGVYGKGAVPLSVLMVAARQAPLPGVPFETLGGYRLRMARGGHMKLTGNRNGLKLKQNGSERAFAGKEKIGQDIPTTLIFSGNKGRQALRLTLVKQGSSTQQGGFS